MVDMGPDNKKLIVENVAKDVTEVNKQKFENINTTIKSNPDQLEKVSKDSLSFLKEYLKADKNSASAMLYNTLKALKSTEKLERDDRKSLEKIRDMILTEEKICTMIDVGAYQLKAEVFNDTFDLVALKKYGKLFNTGGTLTWFGNIKDTYVKGTYADFDKLFVDGEFKDAYFTPAQFQKELYTKNTERMTTLVADLKALDIVTFLKDNTAKVASLDKITNNTDLITILEAKFPTMVDGYYEFNYLLEKNPDIMVAWTKAIDAKKVAETEIINKKTLETLTTDFTADKVLEKYLINNNNVKDAAYLYNKGKDSKLAEIITALNLQITLIPSDTKVANLINFLKAGKLKEFQKSIYTDVNVGSELTNPYDNKIGPETYTILNRYITNLNVVTKMPIRSDVTNPTVVTTEKTNPEISTTTIPTPEVNTTTETAPSATEIKNTLAAFDVSKVTVTLLSGVKPADYKTLFTAVSTKGTDAQVIAANAYMTALTTGKDPTLNGANTDKQPGILTFETICKALGQPDIYATVKARIDKVAADKAAAENTIKAPETLSLNKLDYKFTDNTKTKTLEVQWKNELMGDNYELLTFKYNATGILTSVQEPGHVAIPMPYAVNKTEVFTYGIVPVNRIQSAGFTSLVEPDQTYITISPVDGSIYQGILDNKARFKEGTRFLDNYGSYQSGIFNGPTLISGTNYNGKTGISKEIGTPAVNLANDFDIQPSKFDYIPARESTGTQGFQQQIDLKNKQFKS